MTLETPLRNRIVRIFDPSRDCGATSKRTGQPCTQIKGHRTDHPGRGHCWLHGGNTPNGKKHAAEEGAQRAAAKLGLPVGSGDPMALLTKTVQHAEGYLEGTAAVLAERARDDATASADLAAAANLHAEAIRAAARTGKAAIDAKIAERQAALDERAAGLLERFIGELLERVVPAKRQNEMRIWARDRLAELAAEYDGQPGQVH